MSKDKDELAALEQKIQSLKGDSSAAPAQAEKKGHLLSLAYRMVIEIVVGIGVGGFIGWWLDRQFDTAPILTLILLFLGMFSGVYNALREIKRIAAENNHK